MRLPLNVRTFIGYKGRLLTKFSDSIAYSDGEELFIVTKNFGREGPMGINIGSLPLSSFSDTLEITKGAIISGKSYISFNDCEFWNQNVGDKVKNNISLNRLEDLVWSELKMKVDTNLIYKIEEIFNNEDYKSLGGLGPGLTPLGDDILSGMVLVNKEFSNIKISSVFSKHLFSHAVKNNVPYPIMKFLETLNVNFLRKMGSTSGFGYGLGIIKSIRSGGKNAESNN